MNRELEQALLGCDLPDNDERADYLRARLTPGSDGAAHSDAVPVAGQFHAGAAGGSDCLLIRAPHAPAAKAGSRCTILKLGL